jgi:ATP-dependent RNA helicase DDX56/DBP9
MNVSPQADVSTQRHLSDERPGIVVGTYFKALTRLKARSLNPKDWLEMLLVDEADLVFLFGHESEVKEVLK